MKEKRAAEGGKRRDDAVNAVVNVAVLLFLGYFWIRKTCRGSAKTVGSRRRE